MIKILSQGDIPPHDYIATVRTGNLATREEDAHLVALLGNANRNTLVALVADEEPRAFEVLESLTHRAHDRSLTIAQQIPTEARIIKALHDDNADTAVSRAEKIAMERDDHRFDELFRKIIREAVGLGSSDVHIEQHSENGTLVKYRVNAALVNVRAPMPASEGDHFLNYLFNEADETTTAGVLDPTAARDWRITVNLDGSGDSYRLRVHYEPGSLSQWDLTMRILGRRSDPILSFDKLGYTEDQIDAIDQHGLGRLGGGMTVLAAPTNQGKSTTLRTACEHLYKLHRGSIKIVSVEDPVEYFMPSYIRQSEIIRPTGEKATDEVIRKLFTDFVKSSLRRDPDAIMIGELRDCPTIETAAEATSIGIAVLTTLHADNAHKAFVRLCIQSDYSPAITSTGTVRQIVAQRLLPQVCPHCSYDIDSYYTASENATLPNMAHFDMRKWFELQQRMQQVGIDLGEIRLRGHGCEQCHNTGVIGRVLCAEILVPDDTYLGHMADRHFRLAELYWLTHQRVTDVDGMTMIDHAINHIKRGHVDPMDVESVLGKLTEINRRDNLAKQYARQVNR